jgi:hypothetical protein
VAETPYIKFRLGEHTLADLDALAAPAGGVRSAALREAIHYWRRLVEEAGRRNAEEFGRDDWVRLAHLNNPDMMPPEIEDETASTRDWSQYLAADLCGMWNGKPLLPIHRQEKKACDALARRIAGIGLVRGYAMYCALRHFWGPALGTPGDGEWWHPETWMTPTARAGGG